MIHDRWLRAQHDIPDGVLVKQRWAALFGCLWHQVIGKRYYVTPLPNTLAPGLTCGSPVYIQSVTGGSLCDASYCVTVYTGLRKLYIYLCTVAYLPTDNIYTD